MSLMLLWAGRLMVCAVPVRMPKARWTPTAATLHCAVQSAEVLAGSWTLCGEAFQFVVLLPS